MAINDKVQSLQLRAEAIKTDRRNVGIRAANIAVSQVEFNLPQIALATIRPQLFRIDDIEADSPDRTSIFGTPVYTNLTFPEQTVTDLEGVQITTQGLVIDGVIMTVNQTKNIVTTPVQGRSGTVKEYISDGDYMIEVNGVLAGGQSGIYPEEDVATLVEILKIPQSLDILSEYLDFFEIGKVVVESYDFPQIRGIRNNQNFTIRLLSDEPIELTTIQAQRDVSSSS